MERVLINTSDICTLNIPFVENERSAILLSFVPDDEFDPGRFQNTESYIERTNRMYTERVYDSAPYHYFVAPDGDSLIRIFENKSPNYRTTFADNRLAHNNDISVMFCVDSLARFTKMQLAQVGAFLGELTVDYGLNLSSLVFSDSNIPSLHESDLRHLRFLAILFRNAKLRVFNVFESAYYDARTITELTETEGVKDYPYGFALSSYNCYSASAIVHYDGRILIPGEEYIEMYSGILKQTILCFKNSLDKSLLSVDILDVSSAMSIATNDKVRIVHIVDNEILRQEICEKLSMDMEDFRKLNAHIYEVEETPGVFDMNREFLVLPAIISTYSDYHSLNQVKEGQRLFIKVSEEL